MKYPFMKFYPSEFDRDTRSLTLAACGAWVRILNDLHFNGGERRLTLEGWARVLSASIPQTATVLREIIAAEVCDSNVTADVLPTKNDAEISIKCRRIAREFKTRQQHNLRQKKYADRRTDDDRNDAQMTGKKSEGNISDPYSPHSNNNGNGSEGYGKLFEIFWGIYPAIKRNRFEDCLKEFCKLKPDDALLSRMIAAIEAMIPEWQKENFKYCPGMITWLSGRRWEGTVKQQDQYERFNPMEAF